MPTYDIVVAGAGHNSLTTAGYAARAGYDVGIVEANDRIGGNTRTKELTVPGLKQDTCATAHNFIQASPTIKDDELGLLSEYGLEYLYPDPVIVVPFDDGTSLSMWRDRERTAVEFAKFSEADAEAYLTLLEDYEEVGPHYARARFTPPNRGSIQEEIAKAPNGEQWVRRSLESPRDIIERRFEHPKTRAFMLYMASMTVQPIDRPAGGLLAFSPVYGRQSNSWVLLRGGTQGLPDALAACVTDRGGAVHINQPVEEIIVEDGRAAGVRTRDGTVFEATEAVVSTLHVRHLLEAIPDEHVPDDFRAGVEAWKTGGTLFVTHYALKEAPRYRAEEGPLESIAMGVATSVENLLKADATFERGELHLDDPFVLSICTTVEDESRMVDGLHSLKVLGKLPYDLDRSESWDDIKDEVADRLLKRVRDFAPNLTDDVIVDRHVESPLDLERSNLHNVGGSCRGGDYRPSQYGEHRPVKGYENYRGPVEGLYLTGACTFPGGSVSAAPGRNCAMELLDDLGPGIEAGIRS